MRSLKTASGRAGPAVGISLFTMIAAMGQVPAGAQSNAACDASASYSRAGGIEPNGISDHPSLSRDGRYIAFESDATNLVPGDSNGLTDAFLYDRVTCQTSRISVASDGAEA